MSGKKRSDIVGEEMGKMLLKGYRMLATSCDRCDCVIMQDKQGNQFCVNCMQDKEEAAVSGPSGDVPDPGQVSSQSSEDVKPAIPELNAAALDHKEQIEKIQREVELAIMAEIQRSAAELRQLHLLGDREAYLRHIREGASTLDIIRNLFTTK